MGLKPTQASWHRLMTCSIRKAFRLTSRVASPVGKPPSLNHTHMWCRIKDLGLEFSLVSISAMATTHLLQEFRMLGFGVYRLYRICVRRKPWMLRHITPVVVPHRFSLRNPALTCNQLVVFIDSKKAPECTNCSPNPTVGLLLEPIQ